MKILHIDDQPMDLHSVRGLIVKIGNHELVSVADEKAAMAALKKDGFDLIITDGLLEKYTGIQLTEDIKDAGITTPVVMLTTAPKIAADHTHLFLDVLEKPISIQDLSRLLKLVADVEATRDTQEVIEKFLSKAVQVRPEEASGFESLIPVRVEGDGHRIIHMHEVLELMNDLFLDYEDSAELNRKKPLSSQKFEGIMELFAYINIWRINHAQNQKQIDLDIKKPEEVANLVKQAYKMLGSEEFKNNIDDQQKLFAILRLEDRVLSFVSQLEMYVTNLQILRDMGSASEKDLGTP